MMSFKDMIKSERIRRSFNYKILDKPSEEMAYLLGQLKAGANFLKPQNDESFYICTKDLQHLLKLQILLESDHLPYFDVKREQFYLKIYDVGFTNKLKNLGYYRTATDSPSKNAPFLHLDPEFMPHYVRGYLDERGCPSCDSKNKKTFLAITGSNPEFLGELDEFLVNVTGCPHGYLNKKGTFKSYNLSYFGANTVNRIYIYCYFDAKTHIFCMKKYLDFCRVLNIDPEFKRLNLTLDIASLHKLHRFVVDNHKYSLKPGDYVDKAILQYLLTAKGLTTETKQIVAEMNEQITFKLGLAKSS